MKTNSHARDVIMLTGATAGVGRATARLFADQGACLGLIARDIGRLNETQQEIEKRGGQAIIESKKSSWGLKTR